MFSKQKSANGIECYCCFFIGLAPQGSLAIAEASGGIYNNGI